MNIKSLLVFVSTLCLFNAANADEVDSSSVTTFEDGSPAVAGEVNANFQALINAINDNAAAIAALESSGSAESNSVSGATFTLNQIGIINRGQQGVEGGMAAFATTANLSQQYTLVLNSDGTFAFSGSESEGELNTITGNVILQSQGAAQSETGTWSQNGSTLNLSIGASWTVSADANVIILSEFKTEPDGGGTRTESSFLVGVRTN